MQDNTDYSVLPSDAAAAQSPPADNTDYSVLPSDVPSAGAPSIGASNDQGAFMAGVENFNRSFGRIAEGTMQLGASAVDKILGTNTRAAVDSVAKANDESAAQAASLHPFAAGLGSVIGDTARTVPLMMAAPAASIGQMAASGAAINGGLAALEEAPTLGDRATSGLVSGAVGGVAGAAGGIVGRMASNLMGNGTGTGVLSALNNPSKAATQSILNEAKAAPGGVEQALANADEAAKLGFNLTPAQAIGTDSASAVERNAVLSDLPTKTALMGQNASEQSGAVKSLSDTVDNLVPGGVKATTDARDVLYTKLKDINIGDEALAPVNKNSLIQDYLSGGKMPKSLEGLPDNNAYKLNEVRKLINEDYRNITTGSTQKSDLKAAYNDLTGVLSTHGGDTFNNANKLAQQLILKRDVTEAIGGLKNGLNVKTLANGAQEAETPLKSVYTKLFGTQDKVTDFLDTVKTTGGNVETTKGLINVINNLSNPSAMKLAAKAIGTGTPELTHGVGQAVMDVVNKAARGSYNKEFGKLLTENKWVPAVKELLAKQDNTGAFMKGLQSLLHSVRSGAKTLKVAPASVLGATQTLSIAGNKSYLSSTQQ